MVHILNAAQARAYDRHGTLTCSEHTHCTISQSKEKIEKRTVEAITERVVMIREQAVLVDGRPWQSASGWVPRPSAGYIVMQLITDKGYRLT